MAQYGVKEVLNFTLANYVPNLLDREPILTVDYAQMTDVANAGERIDISGGRGNARLLSFDHSKTVEVNVTLPLIDMKMLALISGDEVTEEISKIFRKEVICPIRDADTGNVYVDLKRKPIEKSVYLYQLKGSRDKGLQGKPVEELPLTGNLGLQEIYVDGDNKKIVLDETAFPVGEEVVVFYTSETLGKVENLRIDPTRFSKTVSVFGDTLFRNQYDEVDEVYNVRIHKARIRPEYTLSMNATDVAVLEFTMDVYAFREKCKNRDTYIEYIKDDEGYDFAPVDLTKYQSALDLVPSTDEILYTTASWSAYQLIVQANQVTSENTQLEVDYATRIILDAQKNVLVLA